MMYFWSKIRGKCGSLKQICFLIMLCLLPAAVAIGMLCLSSFARSTEGGNSDQLEQILAFVQRGISYAGALPAPQPVRLILADGVVSYEDGNVNACYQIGRFSGPAERFCGMLYDKLRSEYGAGAGIVRAKTEITIQLAGGSRFVPSNE